MTRKRLIVWLLALFVLGVADVAAQDKRLLKGQIHDKGGEALVGAQVRWKSSAGGGNLR